MKVFLLDDNPDDRELIKYRLRKQFGALEFMEAGDPATFQTLLAQGGFDAVVTDYMLRWSDGLEVLRQIRERYPNVPVVMVTGSGSEEVAAQGMRGGLSDYVLKQHLERLPYSLQDILERQRLRERRDEAMEQLRRSEARYRLISELISDFAYSLRIESNGQLTQQWATEALTRITGYALEHFQRGEDVLNLIHPDDHAVVLKHFQDALGSDSAVAEFRIVHRDGSTHWLRNYVRQVRDDTSYLLQLYGAAQDITARQQAEAAERDQRRLAEALRDTAEALASALHIDDLLDRVLANIERVVPHEIVDILLLDEATDGPPAATVVRSHGYAEHGLASDWSWTRPWPLADFKALQEMRDTGQPVLIADTTHSALWALMPDTAWLRSWVGVPLRHHDQVMGFIALASATPGFFNEQSVERLQAFADQAAIALHNARLYDSVQQQASELAALYRASGALAGAADSRQLAQQIVETLASEFSQVERGVGLVDEERRRLILAAQSDLGHSTPFPDMALDGQGLCPLAVRTGEVVYARDVTQDERYVAGERQTGSELVIPLKAGGRVLGVIVLHSAERDAFSERDRRLLAAYAERAALALQNAQLLESLTRARQAAEEASRAKSEFLANTSHELRTPLTGILGALDLVLGGLCDSPEEERRFVNVAYSASRHLLGIINNLLDVAKIEAGRLELDRGDVDAALVLAEVLNLVRPQAEAKGLSMSADAPPVPPHVWGDHGRIRQILLNLLDNAIKFTQHGQVTARIEPAGDARQVRIIVADTGIGIPAPQQARLFQPFAQADGSSTRKYGGTGLGLSISRRLAELMGGSLTLFSAGENQGSTFTLQLPLAPTPAAIP
jgi:PAS domain S-box-containing protein